MRAEGIRFATSFSIEIPQGRHGTGWDFATSPGGGALLPWLTGLLSTHAGSLRIGFLVLCLSLGAIFVMALLENRFLRDPVPSLVAHG